MLCGTVWIMVMCGSGTIDANSYGLPVRLTDFLAFGGLRGVGPIPYG